MKLPETSSDRFGPVAYFPPADECACIPEGFIYGRAQKPNSSETVAERHRGSVDPSVWKDVKKRPTETQHVIPHLVTSFLFVPFRTQLVMYSPPLPLTAAVPMFKGEFLKKSLFNAKLTNPK